MKKTISICLIQLYLIIITGIAHGQLSVNAGNDTTICPGTTIQLQGTVQNVFNYWWLPNTSLSAPNVLNPLASPVSNSQYILGAAIIGNNLVYNGDFELGNTGFSSQYIYGYVNNGIGWPGHYWVDTIVTYSPPWSNCADHTPTGPGYKFFADGATGVQDPYGNLVAINGKVWSQTVNVIPNTNYIFSVWFTNLDHDGPASVLALSINGNLLSSQTTANNLCTWTTYYTLWNSGNNTTADISIASTTGTGMGNDFAMDDISFQRIDTVYDTVNVSIANSPNATINGNAEVCLGSAEPAVTLVGNNGNAPYHFYYRINNGTVNTVTSWGDTALIYAPTDQPGQFTYHLIQVSDSSNYHCTTDLNAEVLISVSPAYDNQIYDTVCYGSQVNGYSESGTYSDTFHNIDGCDSISTLNLVVLDSPVHKTIRDTGYNYVIFKNQKYTVNTDISDTLYNRNGCDSIYRDIHLVVLPGKVSVPNAFSPNGDGINDIFKPVLTIDKTFRINQFIIKNRYGQSVFHETGSTNGGWNGTFEGEPCAVGTYYYYLEIEFQGGDTRIFKGDVTLVR